MARREVNPPPFGHRGARLKKRPANEFGKKAVDWGQYSQIRWVGRTLNVRFHPNSDRCAGI